MDTVELRYLVILNEHDTYIKFGFFDRDVTIPKSQIISIDRKTHFVKIQKSWYEQDIRH